MANEMEGFFQELYAYDFDSIEQAVTSGGVLAEFHEADIRATRSNAVFSDQAAFKAYVNETKTILQQQVEYRGEVSETEKIKKEAVELDKKIKALEKDMGGIDEEKLRAGIKVWKQEIADLEAKYKLESDNLKEVTEEKKHYTEQLADAEAKEEKGADHSNEIVKYKSYLVTLRNQVADSEKKMSNLNFEIGSCQRAHSAETKQQENFDTLKAWKETCAQKTKIVHSNEKERESIETVRQRQKDLGERRRAINTFVMEPWVKNMEAGLRRVGFEMDIAGKDRHKVLVWDRQKNSMRQAFDVALTTMGEKLAEPGITRYRLVDQDKFLIKKTRDELLVYRDSATFEPTIVAQEAAGKSFAIKGATPPNLPQPPKEPSAFSKALDKVARWFNGRNETCKHYEEAIKTYQETSQEMLAAWKGSEAFQNCVKDVAEKRKVAWETVSEVMKQREAKAGKEIKDDLKQTKKIQAERASGKIEKSAQNKPKGMGR